MLSLIFVVKKVKAEYLASAHNKKYSLNDSKKLHYRVICQGTFIFFLLKPCHANIFFSVKLICSVKVLIRFKVKLIESNIYDILNFFMHLSFSFYGQKQ